MNILLSEHARKCIATFLKPWDYNVRDVYCGMIDHDSQEDLKIYASAVKDLIDRHVLIRTPGGLSISRYYVPVFEKIAVLGKL